MAGCPDDNALQAFLDRRLDPIRARGLHQHIGSCPVCQELLHLLMARSDSAPPQPLAAPPLSAEDGSVHQSELAHANTPAIGALPQGPRKFTFITGEVVAGRYRIVRFLARGGMGQVYLARDLELGIEVALKTILPQISSDDRALGRFKREVLLAREISHENVCRIFDLGLHQQTGPSGQQTIHFLTMEFLAGHTLAQRLRERGPLDPSEALPLLKQMSMALDAAHLQGIIHRDFKPDNVFVVPAKQGGERVVVTDFGLARTSVAQDGCSSSLTAAGALVGTPAYMSPEQVAGDPVGPAADIYALGVVLYEMVTGKKPFVADTPLGTALKRLKERPPSPRSHREDLNARWEQAILRCLESEPTVRYQSASEVVAALEGQDEGVGRTAGSAVRALVPGLRLNRYRVLRAAVTLLALAAGSYGVARWNGAPAGMVHIQGGTFNMGSSADEVQAAYLWCRELIGDDCVREIFDRERPVRKVTLSPFYLDATEVTNADYAAWLNGRPGLHLRIERYVEDRGVLLADIYSSYNPPHGLIYREGKFLANPGFARKPVTQVTWEGALRYCAAQGRRLPTEAEWEFAARGPEGHRFPWGTEEPDCDGVVIARGPGQPCAHKGPGPADVGTAWRDRSSDGVFDLIGNAGEWVMDRFVDQFPDCQRECRDPVMQGPGPELRSVRGGSWYRSAASARAAGRSRWDAQGVSTELGFRCARPVAAAKP